MLTFPLIIPLMKGQPGWFIASAPLSGIGEVGTMVGVLLPIANWLNFLFYLLGHFYNVQELVGIKYQCITAQYQYITVLY